MTAAMRERAFLRLSAAAGQEPPIRRIHLQVGGELIILEARDGALSTSCTCRREECEHLRAALRLFVVSGDLPGGLSESNWPAGVAGDEQEEPEETPARCLARALEDVIVAIVRTGAGAGETPSIKDAMTELVEQAPRPMPAGMLRWIGRLEGAVTAGDPGLVARLLAGATHAVEELRGDLDDARTRARRVAWLGSEVSLDTAGGLLDRTMIELGREFLAGGRGAPMQRRYILDVAEGELLREERMPGGKVPSVGPCPRVLQVGLADVEPGGLPRRVHLRQYNVALGLGREHWRRIEDATVRSVNELVDTYRSAMDRYPGISEPVVLFRPERIDVTGAGRVFDGQGDSLAIAQGRSTRVSDLLSRSIRGASTPRWLLGRLDQREGELVLHTVSFGTLEADGRGRVVRVT